MGSNCEILVHITGPSMASDDAHYRQLAAAYMAFQPACRKEINALSIPITERHNTSYSQTGAQSTEPTGIIAQSRTPQAITTGFENTFSESQELSFSEAFDNAGSPRLKLPLAAQHEQQPQQAELPTSSGSQAKDLEDSWVQPPSEIPDSMPQSDQDLLARFNSPSRLLEHFASRTPSSRSEVSASQVSTAASQAQTPSGPGVSSPSRGLSPVLGQRSLMLGGPSSQEGSNILAQTSVVVEVPATSRDDVADIEKENPNNKIMSEKRPHTSAGIPTAAWTPEDSSEVEGSVVKDTPLSTLKRKATAATAAAHQRAESEPLVDLKRRRLQAPGQNPPPDRPNDKVAQPLTLERSSSDSSIGYTIADAFEAGRSYLRNYDPRSLGVNFKQEHLAATTLHPPTPPTSSRALQPDDLLTTNLRKIAADLEFTPAGSSRFDPVTVKRGIRPLERGYWLVDCQEWEDGLAELTWCYLANYITKGLAGWSTWCSREDGGGGWRRIRVYCFGYVVKHVYLLLYAATYRKLKTAGAEWVDGAGEVVLRTRA